MFFNYLLPPIVFAAGYTLSRKNFFTNISYIITYGIIGTIINFTLLSGFAYFWSEIVLPKEQMISFTEAMYLACVLCPTDTVAAVGLVKEKDYPKLNAILFGESVVNDAISILLFRTIRNFERDDA